jgi:galactofuranosylgalactofuranosylrhamnosyl-N-acetylglucosaminyl-diphospho-decaprenol beta-1,5/1,6-galactofuranosyltransferase
VSPRILHEVVFPEDADVDVAPLYWDVDQAVVGAPQLNDAGEFWVDHSPMGTINVEHLLDRRSARVPEGTRASTATYFNAFPASYWRRWTTVSEVVLTVRVRGTSGQISVYKSTPDGRQQRIHTYRVVGDSGSVHDVAFPVALSTFGDGGWLWFDLVAGSADLVLERAYYSADVPEHVSRGSVTITITTFNRPTWCRDLLAQLSPAVEEYSVIDRVQVVDQGSQRVSDIEGFSTIADQMGSTLRVIEQANLGGSGGFARGMLEAVEAGESTYVLLLDDDVQIERESIRRAVSFADLCVRPTIVGGHMLSAYARSSLHSFGELVNDRAFRWGPAPFVKEEHDFAVQSLRATPWMHRRIDVDYNAWWMCLIPIATVKDVGLALPFFIKWDDAEYGIRAAKAGYSTVSLPGVALWHVPWTGKDGTVDWQAYFHQRNRLVSALLHSPHRRGGSVVQESFAHQVKHILAMQYSAAALRLLAVEDVLAGPAHLHVQLSSALARVQSLRSGMDDADVKADREAFPAPATTGVPGGPGEAVRPSGRRDVLVRAARGALHQLLPVSHGAYDRPDVALPALNASWWQLSRLDSAVVSMRDGAGFAWYRRRPEQAQELARRTLALHRELLERWEVLSGSYRDQADVLASPAQWRRTFEGSR